VVVWPAAYRRALESRTHGGPPGERRRAGGHRHCSFTDGREAIQQFLQRFDRRARISWRWRCRATISDGAFFRKHRQPATLKLLQSACRVSSVRMRLRSFSKSRCRPDPRRKVNLAPRVQRRRCGRVGGCERVILHQRHLRQCLYVAARPPQDIKLMLLRIYVHGNPRAGGMDKLRP